MIIYVWITSLIIYMWIHLVYPKALHKKLELYYIHSQTCLSGHPCKAATCIKRLPFSCTVIANFI